MSPGTRSGRYIPGLYLDSGVLLLVWRRLEETVGTGRPELAQAAAGAREILTQPCGTKILKAGEMLSYSDIDINFQFQ